jgi:hypothetical protein
LNKKDVYIYESENSSFISHNKHFSDIKSGFITIVDPKNSNNILSKDAVILKK